MIGGMSDYLENKLLDHALGKTTYTMPTNHLALFTAAPTDAGGGTEVTGGSYARQNATTALGAASSGSSTTTSQITFPDATANWGEILAWATFDASTAGNMLWWGWLGTGAEIPGVAANTGDVFTSYAHGLVNTNQVVLQAPEGGTLPTGVSANTRYYVVSATTDTFQLSLTSGGAAIALTSDGEFNAYQIQPKTINSGDGFKFNAGNLTFKLN
jgi:hypothetical protein